jgi:hypothetical protein
MDDSTVAGETGLSSRPDPVNWDITLADELPVHPLYRSHRKMIAVLNNPQAPDQSFHV